MDALRQIIAQFSQFYGKSASERFTLLVVPLLVVGGLIWLMQNQPGSAEEAVLSGKTFSAEDLREAEDALRQAGLTQFKTAGQKIMAPKKELDRYNGVLITLPSLSAQFGEEFARVHSDGNPFESDKARQERIEFAKARELAKMIRAIPEVEDAGVVWQRSKQSAFNGGGKVTATVGVKSRAGRDLSRELLQSLRLSVAGAFGMSPENVTVIDLRKGRVGATPNDDDPSGSEMIDRQREYAALYQKTIADALNYIPGVIVTVNVQLENLKSSREQARKFDKQPFPTRSTEETQTETSNESRPGAEPGVASNQPRSVRTQAAPQSSHTMEKTRTESDSIPLTTTVTDKQYMGLTMQSLQVAVAIPRDYYRSVAVQSGESETDKAAFQAKMVQIEQETEKKVSQTVARLISPAGGALNTDAVNIVSFTPVDSAEPIAAQGMPEMAIDLLTQWGGPAGLALFALWTLWMLNRSMKKLPQEAVSPATPNPAKPAAGPEPSAAAEEPVAAREPTKRDQLQVLVKDNPEMAASVISRWISPAK
jgi:flagellar M-ring protein FliF